jgi:hypothetical protein
MFGMMLTRRGSFGIWLAVRSIVTAAAASVVAIVLNHTAMPSLLEELRDSDMDVPQWLEMIVGFQPLLPWVGLPGVILGIAALMLRPLRKPLALLASLLSVAAIALVVATLVSAMIPFYQSSHDVLMGS